MLVPLTQVEVFAIVTEVGAGKLRASDPLCFRKSFAGKVSAKIAIIFRTFADRKPKIFSSGDRGPGNSGRFSFFEHRPRLYIDPIDAPQIARAHPQLPAMPGERLRCQCGRRESLPFIDCWQCLRVSCARSRFVKLRSSSSENSDRLSLREFARCAACSARH